MAVNEQKVTKEYAVYNGDCIEVMADLPDNKIDMSIYSPPFASMYTYSSSDRDLGNNKNYAEFLEHYRFVVKEIYRLTKPGRMTCVHCMDIPKSGDGGLVDFPGDIIRMHQEEGFKFWDRKNIWKEPLRVAIRTRQRALMHIQLIQDSSKVRGALADYLLIFKKKGENETPIYHPRGLTSYDGDLTLMNSAEREEYDILEERFRDATFETDKEASHKNRFSQFIWRRYASSAWEDIRANRSLCYKPARDKDDDRHVCPLQLDIITRAVNLYSNENEVVLTPFMGIGSEVFGAVINNRKGIGIELKESYYRQAIKNLHDAGNFDKNKLDLFTFNEVDESEIEYIEQ